MMAFHWYAFVGSGMPKSSLPSQSRYTVPAGSSASSRSVRTICPFGSYTAALSLPANGIWTVPIKAPTGNETLVLPWPPSLSVADRLMVYVPVSSGVNAIALPVPEAKPAAITPSWVLLTDQA